MHPLLITLAQWPGRRPTKALLESRGYWLPRRYEEIVSASCSDMTSLEKYWDEVAMEYMCSAGLGNADRRTVSETSYRSKYLDDLASERIKRDGILDGASLNTWLREFKTVMQSSPKEEGASWTWLHNQLRKHKKDEIEGFRISADQWTGKKKDFYDFLGKISEARGFQFKKKKWRKNFDDLEICCSVDKGMHRAWAFQLPFNFEIFHRAELDFVFNFARANTLMPGFHYYSLHKQPEEAILGIQAHVDLLDAIGELTTS